MAEQPKAQQKRTEPESDDKGTAKSEAEVQSAVDQENKAGLRGTEVDMTPNENYTVEGVLAGKPVPEAEADPTAARHAAQNPDL